ncbi:uncharacterized protein YALI1_A17546g [Yarrowia lipolytica]|jgi:hypothetical protein|nr:hypothetical protein YALI1_A17546g [Yarrowia lipolytica]
MDEYDRAVEMLSKAGVCIKGSPPKSTRTEGATLTSFKNFNPESQWNGEDDDGDLTQIDPFLQSQTLSPTQPPGPATEPPVMSQTFVDPPSSSQASPPYQFKHSRSARLAPSSSQSYLPVKPTPLSQPRRFSETSTWKRTVDDMPSLGASPVSSPPNSPKRAKSWKKHFTPADTDVRSGNGMVSRGTQTEDPEWLTDTQAMENHIVDVVQNPLFDAYVARIKELMKGDQFEKDGF